MTKKRSKFYFWMSLVVFLLLGAIYLAVPKYFADEVYPLEYTAFIVKYSKKYGVDPSLVAAVILQESRFNPKARSGAGAQGLMQFMPGTAATMAKETGRWPKYDIFDPETSVEFGAAHLRDLLVKYDGNVDAALAAYNAGTGTVDRWYSRGILGRIPVSQGYVKRIRNYQTVYQTMYASELGLEPIQLLENPETNRNNVRGFVWSQIFSNVINYF